MTYVLIVPLSTAKIENVKRKSTFFCKPSGRLVGAAVHFLGSPQYTGLHCGITDMGFVHRAVCLFTCLVFASTHCGC